MESAQIRHATADDADKIAAVHVRSWQIAYRGYMPENFLDNIDVEKRAKLWREVTQNPDKITLVAQESGTIVGFAALGPSRDSDATLNMAEVSAIYVDPERWREGIGRSLLAASLDQLRTRGFDQLTLWVLEANSRARSFYKSFGFVEDGAAKHDDHSTGVVLCEVRYRMLLRAH
jgi:GNAT superfamily N-acetyltransferase